MTKKNQNKIPKQETEKELTLVITTVEADGSPNTELTIDLPPLTFTQPHPALNQASHT